MKGLSLPLRFSSLGHLERSEGSDRVRESIESICRTFTKERYGRPEYGNPLRLAIFRDADQTLFTLLEDSLAEAIIRNEPRAVVRDVTVSSTNGSVQVSIEYDDRSGQSSLELTLPAQ